MKKAKVIPKDHNNNTSNVEIIIIEALYKGMPVASENRERQTESSDRFFIQIIIPTTLTLT